MKNLLSFIIIVFILTAVRCRWPLDNPSDSRALRYTVESEAQIEVSGIGPFFQFDTAFFKGGVSSRAVENDGLISRYLWDFGNDGEIDTILKKKAILGVPLRKLGTYSVALELVDRLGYKSKDVASIMVLPSFNLQILLPDIDISIDSTCAFYTQNQYTMRPVVLMGRYFTYRNKSESMELGDFIFEFLRNLTGTLDYNTLSNPYKTSFSNGVYTLSNGSLTMKAAFHYGPGIDGHNEDDTIRHDLFNPRSYIKSFGAQLSAPYYSYEPGPLWDLTSGFKVDVSDRLKPQVSLDIAIGDLKFSGFREVEGRYTLTAAPVDTSSLTAPAFDAILFDYHGLAAIKPLRIADIESIVQNDSLEIDMSGSQIVSDSFPMTFTIEDNEDTARYSYNFLLNQLMLQQRVRFGNSGGDRKIQGSYSAQSQISVNQFSLLNSYFSGVYSTTEADTACFFCDSDLTLQFGDLYFDSPQRGFFTFISDRYTYHFTMRDGLVLPSGQ